MFIRALCILGIKDKNGEGPIWPGAVAEVDDKTGKRLVSIGHAEEVSNSKPQTTGKAPLASNPTGNTPKTENEQKGPENGENVKGHLDGTDLETMSFADLKALAKDMGIDTGKIKSKSGMIEAITAVEVEAPLTEDDDLPDLTPQEVIEE